MRIVREWFFIDKNNAGFRYLVDGEEVTRKVAEARANGRPIPTVTNRPPIK